MVMRIEVQAVEKPDQPLPPKPPVPVLQGLTERVQAALSRAVVVERLLLKGSRIIPGDWGKAVSGWLAWPLWRS
jgi:hypothetical protein